MTDTNEEVSKEEYVAAVQEQVVEILNKVKEELGVDTPVEIIISDGNEDTNDNE